ncbi:MAG: 3-isopropylmalate dehydratase small subunit [Myxococcales bacterium]|nr:3-isopropylmalate dehydratase small subunit [Myxococcales bacterium]MCB9732755.1 3-isopropylmalate dehydratase small subunit [Deltaproteobacteria bacterium]
MSAENPSGYPVPLRSRAVRVLLDNIDTDQITPARFLKSTDKAGLGEVLFCDWRKDPAFALNQPGARDARILVAGDNFGCGSSREHAPWALVGWGFRAIVATSFADIFRNNAHKNGLLPVIVPPAVHARVVAALEADPAAELEVDLPARELVLPSGERAAFPLDDFVHHCLLTGLDELGYLLAHDPQITAFEAKHP